jgi:hypothetical protein
MIGRRSKAGLRCVQARLGLHHSHACSVVLCLRYLQVAVEVAHDKALKHLMEEVLVAPGAMPVPAPGDAYVLLQRRKEAEAQAIATRQPMPAPQAGAELSTRRSHGKRKHATARPAGVKVAPAMVAPAPVINADPDPRGSVRKKHKVPPVLQYLELFTARNHWLNIEHLRDPESTSTLKQTCLLTGNRSEDGLPDGFRSEYTLFWNALLPNTITPLPASLSALRENHLYLYRAILAVPSGSRESKYKAVAYRAIAALSVPLSQATVEAGFLMLRNRETNNRKLGQDLYVANVMMLSSNRRWYMKAKEQRIKELVATLTAFRS